MAFGSAGVSRPMSTGRRSGGSGRHDSAASQARAAVPTAAGSTRGATTTERVRVPGTAPGYFEYSVHVNHSSESREEQVPDRLAIVRPELGPQHRPTDRACQYPPHGRVLRDIEEHDRVGTRPHDVRRSLGEVIPVDDPLVAGDRGAAGGRGTSRGRRASSRAPSTRHRARRVVARAAGRSRRQWWSFPIPVLRPRRCDASGSRRLRPPVRGAGDPLTRRRERGVGAQHRVIVRPPVDEEVTHLPHGLGERRELVRPPSSGRRTG